VACVLGTSLARPLAQAEQTAPAFDVASIKASDSADSNGGSVFQPNGRYMSHNQTLRDTILEAYRIRSFQLVGGPSWINSDRFEIAAKAENPADFQPVPQPNGVFAPPAAPFLRVQTLLKDRFQLGVHHEQREGAVYALTLARSDKRLGAKLQKRSVSCQDVTFTPAAPREFCGGVRRTSGLFTGRGATMAQLASSLSAVLGRAVLDRTDVGGLFDFDLEWTPTTAATPLPNSDALIGPETSLFTALQEQLGLKLESTRGLVDVIVIDHVERPMLD